MKQLTTEKQQQAIELISDLAENEPNDYIALAKEFLNSLKPKVYVCKIAGFCTFFYCDNDIIWTLNIDEATSFNSTEKAREALYSIPKDEGFKYFILTE